MMKKRVIGLTGGIASGKTKVAEELSRLGALVIDADQIARAVIENPEIKNQLEKTWPEVFERGFLNRKKLRQIIFSSREEREKLNALLHPPIIQQIIEKIEQANDSICVIVAPLLIESGLHQTCDEIWVVHAPRKTQIERLMERDQITQEEALAMLESQLSSEEKMGHAHRVIDNSGPFEKTREQIKDYWNDFLKAKSSF
jgi:dephospho-CoA kinase